MGVDYRQMYKLGDEPLVVPNGDRSIGGMIDAAMEERFHGQGFDVHRKGKRDAVRFSNDGWRETSDGVLLLSTPQPNKVLPWKSMKPLVALRFLGGVGYANIYMNYVQTVRRIGLEGYLAAQEVIGARPHELLVAHFISRMSPVLAERPDMDLVLNDSVSENTSYRIIRERFLDKKRRLNPNKARVRQLLGEDNPWLYADRSAE